MNKIEGWSRAGMQGQKVHVLKVRETESTTSPHQGPRALVATASIFIAAPKKCTRTRTRSQMERDRH
jgi:hypothetical protein